MKTTGALWNLYMASWPEGQWFDDSDERVGDISLDEGYIPKDADVVEFTCGTVFASENDKEGKSLVRHFSAWKKSLDVEQFVCNIPKEKVAEFKELMTSLGVTLKSS